MNTLNEFIFIASGITLTFTIVIIGLIIANSKNKSEIKKSHSTIKQVKEKWEQSSIGWHKSGLDKDKTIKQLNSEVEFKDGLIHGYKKDVEKAIDGQFFLDKQHQETETKLKEAIEYLEKLNTETTELNARVARDNQTLRYNNEDLQNHINKLDENFITLLNLNVELNLIIDEYSLLILNRCK